MNRLLSLATAITLGLTAATAMAQTAPPTRVRGTIASVEGNVLTVTGRSGQAMPIALSDNLTVMTVKKVELSAITENTYVGIATRAGADGKLTALEVLVFPEAARGSGEGHYAWDLEPGSMMTNGTVKGAVTATSGRELSVAYKDGSQTIAVPPATPVVTFAPAQRSDLKPGAPVFLGATKDADGKLSASRVVVGTDGVAPPM
jgi:Domain of unknown function (DUF5666)